MKDVKKWLRGSGTWAAENTGPAILGAFGILVIVVIVIFETLPPEGLAHQKLVGDAIQPFGIAIGALLSGLGGFNYVDERVKQRRLKREESQDWRIRFPINRLGKDFEVVESDKQPGVLYVHNLKTNQKHWIVDPKTLRALGLSYADVKTLPQKEFDALPRGENIQIEV